MSNNYTQFSVALEMPSEESIEYALVLKSRLDDARGEEITEGSNIPEEFQDVLENWGGFHCQSDTFGDKRGLWISHGMESGDPEAAVFFIRHLLSKYHPEGCFEFSWACWCDKPRIDEFAGGAAFITAKEIHWMGPHTWLGEQRRQFEDPDKSLEQLSAEADELLSDLTRVAMRVGDADSITSDEGRIRMIISTLVARVKEAVGKEGHA